MANTATAQVLHPAQETNHSDTVRGTVTPERIGWDVQYYDLHIEPSYAEKSIKGTNAIRFLVTAPFQRMQLDLQSPMHLDQVQWRGTPVPYQREGNVYYIDFPHLLEKGSTDSIVTTFSGQPKVAARPPWDGGWIFSKDQKGRPWMTVACQGLGASVWFPCKDHQSDEPDRGASLRITVPDTLVAVGNGRLVSIVQAAGNRKTYAWKVSSPINNYCIIPYIGKYAHWSEQYAGEAGVLDCDYWVLDYELEKAKKQFQQVPVMLKSFEYWFGPYPFYEDGYKLVQAPHLGMEHQSAVAYGNRFQNGYLGRDLSQSGWGTKWDFIIVHESGHEWFGNNITTADIADMWIHEGFTNYSETLFTTSLFGKEAGIDYVTGTRKLIQHDIPIIGPYGVNKEGSGDMYYKGGNLIHMIRTMMDNDEAFRNLLRAINTRWRHQITTSEQVERFLSEKTGLPLEKVFDQYLRSTGIPTLEYRVRQGLLQCRWTDCVDAFQMKIRIYSNGQGVWIAPETRWKDFPFPDGLWTDIVPDRNFYINSRKVE